MEFRTQERTFGASTVFRVVNDQFASQLPRRERWVLLLLDGRRSVADLARIMRRSELDIAYTLARFLQWGCIERVNTGEFTIGQFQTGYDPA